MGVHCTVNGSNQVTVIRARMVVDASGQARVLGRKLKLVEWHEDLKNIAIWTYFQGHLTYPGRKAGNILVENMPDGWLWFIPFSDNTVSVGWVSPAAEVATTPMSPSDLIEKKIADSVEVSRMLAPAHRVGRTRTTRDWSYTCRRFGGPGYLLVISFVRYFYDASKDKEIYWAEAQSLIDPIKQMTARQDFVTLISGLG